GGGRRRAADGARELEYEDGGRAPPIGSNAAHCNGRVSALSAGSSLSGYLSPVCVKGPMSPPGPSWESSDVRSSAAIGHRADMRFYGYTALASGGQTKVCCMRSTPAGSGVSRKGPSSLGSEPLLRLYWTHRNLAAWIEEALRTRRERGVVPLVERVSAQPNGNREPERVPSDGPIVSSCVPEFQGSAFRDLTDQLQVGGSVVPQKGFEPLTPSLRMA